MLVVTIEVEMLPGVVARVKRVTMVLLRVSLGAVAETFFIVVTENGEGVVKRHSRLLLLETNILAAPACSQKHYTNPVFRRTKPGFG